MQLPNEYKDDSVYAPPTVANVLSGSIIVKVGNMIDRSLDAPFIGP